MIIPQPLATALVLSCLVRGLTFAPGGSTVGSFNKLLQVPYRGVSPQPAQACWQRTAFSHIPTTDGRNMVLRPDWEREGRAFGLRMPLKKEGERAFEYLVEYPCEFVIKVIGLNEGSFADDIAATVSAVCEVNAADVRFTVRVTPSGKYQSITVHAPVRSSKMLYRCYEMIDEDPRVKFKF